MIGTQIQLIEPLYREVQRLDQALNVESWRFKEVLFESHYIPNLQPAARQPQTLGFDPFSEYLRTEPQKNYPAPTATKVKSLRHWLI